MVLGRIVCHCRVHYKSAFSRNLVVIIQHQNLKIGRLVAVDDKFFELVSCGHDDCLRKYIVRFSRSINLLRFLSLNSGIR